MVNVVWSSIVFVLLLSGCGWNGAPTRINNFTPLTSIEISADYSTIAANTSTRLVAKGNFSGLFTRDITDQVVWSSDTASVAEFVTAANASRVTGHAPGSAQLTATVGGISTTYLLTVSSAAVTGMTITPAAPTLFKGLDTQCAVNGTFTDGTTQDLTFDATWSSDTIAVATVSDDPLSKGLAHAVAIGSATISASFGGISGATLLTVTAPVLQSITVTPGAGTVLSLSKVQFTATGTYSDGTTSDITGSVGWNSSKTDIAAINTGGTATALVQGTASISAALGAVNGTTNLTVTGGNLVGITLSAASISMVKDTAGRISATGTFSNGATRDITGAVAWSVTNPAVAAITIPSGNLAWLTTLAVTPTTTVTAVTAKSGTLTATANLTVTAPTLSANGLTIVPANRDITVGSSGRFTVTASFSDGTSQNVTADTTWTSGNTAKAGVGNSGLNKGRVTGAAAGTVTISAEYGGQTVTAPVTVTARTLTSLTIPAVSAVASGKQVPFTVTATYGDGTSQDVTEDAVWTTDTVNSVIFADNLNQPGQIVGLIAGSTKLTASFDGKSQTTTVTVP